MDKVEKLPADVFSENNGYWWSIHPGDYSRLIRPSERNCPAAISIRTLILDWAKKMGARASRSREDFLKGWKETEETERFTISMPEEIPEFDYLDVEEDFALTYISLVPGTVFVDVVRGVEKFRLFLSDNVYKNNADLRSLSRRLGTLPSDALPFTNFEGEKELSRTIKSQLAAFLSISEILIEFIRRRSVSFKRKSGPSEQQSKKSKPAATLQTPTGATPVIADTAPRLGSLPEAPVTSHLATSSSMAVSMFARPGNTACLSKESSPVLTKALPSLPVKESKAVTVPTTANAIRPTPVTSTAVAYTPATIHSAMDSETPPAPLRKTVTKPPRALESLPPGPTQDYRATKLLKMGGMPHWQPARRSWEADEEVSFAEGELTIFWPPKGWKMLTPDQKLLQWEFTAMSLLRARGVDTTAIERADLLDDFNFLALPGTSAHKRSKHSPSYMIVKSRYFTYETLRQIAIGQYVNEKWLTMVEAGAMMRCTANDKLLKMCSNIKLRLTKE
ncbi:MAG: hypothetical protein JAY74_09800 [Candidatus Thiodiazotropha taylori]|nr:hypothetical protein [Candidatus Thiodiazotropha taylori]